MQNSLKEQVRLLRAAEDRQNVARYHASGPNLTVWGEVCERNSLVYISKIVKSKLSAVAAKVGRTKTK